MTPKSSPTIGNAILALETQLAEFVAEKDRSQLTGIPSDKAYELGYESAIFDLRKFFNPSTFEVSVVSFPIPIIQDENKNSETSI